MDLIVMERLKRLTDYGYTQREARFIELAALQSGYFVRRQFNDFSKSQCGALAQSFIEKATALCHISVLKYSSNRFVYHFSNFSLFAALQDSNNRNRRRHQNETVRRRLMALDFCIHAPAAEYLLTESEKTDFFTAAGVPESDLPFELFGGSAKRYFVDRQPVTKEPQIIFIDEGMSTLLAWEAFLRKHRPLLQVLPELRIVFASPEGGRFPEAERVYRKTVAGTISNGEIDLRRLRSYFESRRLFESREFSTFDQARLNQLREDRKLFSGAETDALFRDWIRGGDQVLGSMKGRKGYLEFCKLPKQYEWLSPIRKEIRDAAYSGTRKKG